MDTDVAHELYLSLLLLGADPLLLASVENWRNGIDQNDVLTDLRNWNEAKRLEQRIEFLHSASSTRAR